MNFRLKEKFKALVHRNDVKNPIEAEEKVVKKRELTPQEMADLESELEEAYKAAGIPDGDIQGEELSRCMAITREFMRKREQLERGETPEPIAPSPPPHSSSTSLRPYYL